MSSPKYSPSQVVEIAKRTLGLPANAEALKVPSGYLVELEKHVRVHPHDTQFVVQTEPGNGYGRVICHESDCDRTPIKLSKNMSKADGGKSEGVGSLTAYRQHMAVKAHKDSRLARLKSGQKANTLSSNSTSSPSTPARLMKIVDRLASTPNKSPLQEGSVTPNIQKISSTPPAPFIDSVQSLPRKRQSDGIPSGRESAFSEGDLSMSYNQPQISASRAISGTRPATNTSSASIIQDAQFSPSKRMKLSDSSDSNNRDYALLNRDINIVRLTTLNHPPSSAKLQGAAGDVLYETMSQLSNTILTSVTMTRDSGYEPDDNERAMDLYTAPVARPGDLQKFFQDAGNAELFDKSASVGTALEKLGLPSLNTLYPGLSIALMPHQVIGVAWMIGKETSAHKGGIMSDEMGLGKTVQMIATMMSNRSDDPAVKTTLIVAPLALLDQWKLEIEMKTNDAMSVLVYHGQNKTKSKKELMKHDVVLTTFQTLAMEYPDPELEDRKATARKRRKDDFIVSDSEDEKSKAKAKAKTKKDKAKPGLLVLMRWHRVVLDEAQYIKNKRTRGSRAVTQLDSEYKWCLTGTPITNGLGDIYPLLRFLQIRPWNDWMEYKNHVIVFERKNSSVATTRLQAILSACLLRRKKDSMLDGKRLIELPAKDVFLTKLDFTPDERDIYKMVETRSQQIFNKYLRAGTVLKNYAQVLVMLLRLRQICSHTSLITEEEDVIVDDDLENTMEENRDEIIHAQTVVGREFVVKLKSKLKEVWQGRMKAEKESLDAAIEGEECPVCYDILNNPIVTRCMHFFCRDCIEPTLQSAHVVDAEQPNKYKQNERPCPVCREPISHDTIFLRKAFEPTDEDLQENPKSDVSDDRKAKSSSNLKLSEEEGDEEMPDIPELFSKGTSTAKRPAKGVKGKGKGRAKSSRRSGRKKRVARRILDSDEDEGEAVGVDDEDDDVEDDYEDDDLSDFIVEDDEDEVEKDARKALKQRMRGRVSHRRIESEDESDVEVVIDPKQKKKTMNKGPIKVLSKMLPSTKMKHMMDHLLQWAKEHPDEKTIVVSQWTQCLDLVSNYLITKDFVHVRYQGNMNRKKRDTAIRNFMQSDRVSVMLMSLKCGGVGLNLTRANRVISLDLGWSEAVENQAFDRVHRLGQTRSVVVHRLVINDTVEDRVLALQERKRNLADGSLGEGSGKKIGRLSVRELARLFGLDHNGNVL